MQFKCLYFSHLCSEHVHVEHKEMPRQKKKQKQKLQVESASRRRHLKSVLELAIIITMYVVIYSCNI